MTNFKKCHAWLEENYPEAAAYYMANGEQEDINNRGLSEALWAAYDWGDTPDGAKYWQEIDQHWRRFVEGGKNAPVQADRANTGKMRWTLMDFESMKDMIEVLEFGAKKYSKDNWKKGLPVTEITDSMMRHLVAFLAGEDIDPESGLPHTGHIMCNAMFLSHMYKFKPEFDDRVISKKEAEGSVQS